MEREGELLERVGRLFGISSPNPALISASILHKELMESSGWGKTKGQPSDRPTGDGAFRFAPLYPETTTRGLITTSFVCCWRVVRDVR